MDVLVERYQRRKYVNQEDAPMLYYIRQKAGNVRVMDVDTIVDFKGGQYKGCRH